MEGLQNSTLVSISCLTYNHVAYIRKCLNGFMNQQCNFDFEVLIHDDASTDGTAAIIREYERKYPNVIKPIYQTENQWSKDVRGMNQKFNFPRAKGKYIAMCEGDDYWTDPLKLQKQIDFLELHPDFSLACGGYIKKGMDSDEEVVIDNAEAFLKANDVGFEFGIMNLQKNWITKTLTIVFRREAIKLEEFTKYRYTRDVHLVYHILKNGKGVYFPEVFGVYNMHEGGIHTGATRHSLINNSFHVYTELYRFNSDDAYVQRKALSATLSKLSFDFRNINSNITGKSRFKTLRQACSIAKSPRDVFNIIRVLVAFYFSAILNLKR